jgi:hypothetical protein
LQEGRLFNEITTFRLAYPECCRLADPGVAHDLLLSAERVDRLSGFTVEMWDILTGVVLQEWFGLRLPPSKLPWDGSICLPPNLRLNYCLDRTYARQAHSRIQSRYLSLDENPGRMSIFSGCGFSIPNDFQREREGLLFLARQADHFRSFNDYLFITQTLYADEKT